MAKVFDCSFEVNEFELQSFHYIHFWTNTLGIIARLKFELAYDEAAVQRVNHYAIDFILFTQPLRSGRIWHKVKFLSGV